MNQMELCEMFGLDMAEEQKRYEEELMKDGRKFRMLKQYLEIERGLANREYQEAPDDTSRQFRAGRLFTIEFIESILFSEHSLKSALDFANSEWDKVR